LDIKLEEFEDRNFLLEAPEILSLLCEDMARERILEEVDHLIFKDERRTRKLHYRSIESEYKEMDVFTLYN
jgi:hypothetical protein